MHVNLRGVADVYVQKLDFPAPKFLTAIVENKINSKRLYARETPNRFVTITTDF